MIFATWIVNISLLLILVMITTSICLYNCKKLIYTRNLHYIFSIFMLVYIGLYINIPADAAWYEKSAIWLQILPYFLLGIIIFTLSLYKDLTKK